MEASILAEEQSGEDVRKRGGLPGFFVRLARTEPKLFAKLLVRVLLFELVSQQRSMGKHDKTPPGGPQGGARNPRGTVETRHSGRPRAL
jgi:hypothetical protein